MNRNKIIRNVGIISFMIILGCLFLFIIFPMILLPPYPASLVRIYNFGDIDHIVSVEIFDSENNSIYYESFVAKPDISIKIKRDYFDWCAKGRFWWLLPWDEGSYTFYITLDDTYNISHFIEQLQPSMTVDIDIYLGDVPLEVGNAFTD